MQTSTEDGSGAVALKTWLAVAEQELQCGRKEQALSIIGSLYSQFDEQGDAEASAHYNSWRLIDRF